jgi:hypothetical protein
MRAKHGNGWPLKLRIAVSLVFVMLFLFATSGTTQAKTGQQTIGRLLLSQNWLERLNYYRQAAGLPAVVESPIYSADLVKHVNYMLLHVATEGLWHGETPGNSGYTLEGDQAARESNLFWFPSGALYGGSPAMAMDTWMGSIGHRFGMLNPDLITTGFSFGCDSNNCGAGLNVLRGVVWDTNPRPNGVFYPGPNQVDVNTDIIITWQFLWDPTIILKSASLQNSSGQSIAFTSTTPANGDYFNVVSIRPNSALAPGTTYRVSLTVQRGMDELTATWSFTTEINPTTLVNSVLPTSRSIQVGTTATVFNTVLNGGSETAYGVTLATSNLPPGAFAYQESSCATNVLIGGMNPSLDIPAGQARCYVLFFTPSAAFASTDVHIRAQAANAPPTSLLPGINAWTLRATSSAGPDIIALTTTTDFHQIACSGTKPFAVAMSNVGAATSQVTVTADTGLTSLPLSILIQESDPVTGTITGDNILENVGAGENRTVVVWVTFNGCTSFDPATRRIFIRFKDGSNNLIGSTSTAVSTNR